MKRYYFDIRDGEELVVDAEGMELPAIGLVQAEAARALADLAADVVQNDFKIGAARALAVEVRDATGPVLQARFTFDIGEMRRSYQ